MREIFNSHKSKKGNTFRDNVFPRLAFLPSHFENLNFHTSEITLKRLFTSGIFISSQVELIQISSRSEVSIENKIFIRPLSQQP